MSGAATCPHGRQPTICAVCAPALEQQLLEARKQLGEEAGTKAHQLKLADLFRRRPG